MTTPQYDVIISKQQSEIEALKAENEKLKEENQELKDNYVDLYKYYLNYKEVSEKLIIEMEKMKEQVDKKIEFLKKHGR